MKYTPEKESLTQHEVPKWFHDAKLGIFIHWSLFSVPAFAAEKLTLVESQKRGVDAHMKNNPYAEWYLNSLMIDGSPTQKYHKENYGDDFSYDGFATNIMGPGESLSGSCQGRRSETCANRQYSHTYLTVGRFWRALQAELPFFLFTASYQRCL